MEGLTPEERRDLILSVGTHRGQRRLSPLEVAQLLAKARESGATRRECSEVLQVSLTQIGTFLKLLQLAPEVQHLAGWGGARQASIPFSSLAELHRLPPLDQLHVAEVILGEGLTWKEVIELAQIANRSSDPIEECIKVVLARRPQIERRYLLMGKVDDRAADSLSALSQRERDSLLDQVLQDLLGGRYAFEARLGQGHFTVLTSEDILIALKVDADELERQINARTWELCIARDLSN